MSSAVTFTRQVLSAESTRRTTVRWRWRGIDDFRAVGVQLPKPIDQRLRSGGTLTRRTADRMIPDKLRDAGLGQEGPDGRQAGFERQVGAVTQVEYPFFGIRRRRIRVDQGPTTIEDARTERLRHVDILEVRRAESRHEEYELQIRHSGITHVQLGHNEALW